MVKLEKLTDSVAVGDHRYKSLKQITDQRHCCEQLQMNGLQFTGRAEDQSNYDKRSSAVAHFGRYSAAAVYAALLNINFF